MFIGKGECSFEADCRKVNVFQSASDVVHSDMHSSIFSQFCGLLCSNSYNLSPIDCTDDLLECSDGLLLNLKYSKFVVIYETQTGRSVRKCYRDSILSDFDSDRYNADVGNNELIDILNRYHYISRDVDFISKFERFIPSNTKDLIIENRKKLLQSMLSEHELSDLGVCIEKKRSIDVIYFLERYLKLDGLSDISDSEVPYCFQHIVASINSEDNKDLCDINIFQKQKELEKLESELDFLERVRFGGFCTGDLYGQLKEEFVHFKDFMYGSEMHVENDFWQCFKNNYVYFSDSNTNYIYFNTYFCKKIIDTAQGFSKESAVVKGILSQIQTKYNYLQVSHLSKLVKCYFNVALMDVYSVLDLAKLEIDIAVIVCCCCELLVSNCGIGSIEDVLSLKLGVLQDVFSARPPIDVCLDSLKSVVCMGRRLTTEAIIGICFKERIDISNFNSIVSNGISNSMLEKNYHILKLQCTCLMDRLIQESHLVELHIKKLRSINHLFNRCIFLDKSRLSAVCKRHNIISELLRANSFGIAQSVIKKMKNFGKKKVTCKILLQTDKSSFLINDSLFSDFKKEEIDFKANFSISNLNYGPNNSCIYPESLCDDYDLFDEDVFFNSESSDSDDCSKGVTPCIYNYEFSKKHLKKRIARNDYRSQRFYFNSLGMGKEEAVRLMNKNIYLLGKLDCNYIKRLLQSEIVSLYRLVYETEELQRLLKIRISKYERYATRLHSCISSSIFAIEHFINNPNCSDISFNEFVVCSLIEKNEKILVLENYIERLTNYSNYVSSKSKHCSYITSFILNSFEYARDLKEEVKVLKSLYFISYFIVAYFSFSIYF